MKACRTLVVTVTGASRGIGAAVAQLAGSRGSPEAEPDNSAGATWLGDRSRRRGAVAAFRRRFLHHRHHP
jgi:NAD(P)-dependent dehydrogenase (short-subunit alcohol dehydrogenase family)